MWFMNRIANPFVRLVLRSPLHRLMSASVLLITVRGRKSGKAYTLPVQYVQAGKTITIIPGAPGQKTWWRNLRCGAAVDVLLAGRTLHGNACTWEGTASTDLITGALDAYLHRFPAAARLYHVSVGQDGKYDQGDLRRAAASTVVVNVDLEE